jgi:hypothetical protein
MFFFLSTEKPKWYLSLFNVLAGLAAGLFVVDAKAVKLVFVFPFFWAVGHCIMNHHLGDYRLHRMSFELEVKRAGKSRVLGLPPLWAFYLSEGVEALAVSLAAGGFIVALKMWAGIL